jgi:hypothetical protein
MKKCFITILLFSWFTSASLAQDSIPCNRFQIDSVWLVQAGINRLMVRLHFIGNQNDFINYPYFPLVVSQFGDTIATGEMEYFGQFGNSSQQYSTMTMLNELPPIIFLRFRYNNDSCNFKYIITRLAGLDHSRIPEIFPNPVKDRIFVRNNSGFEGYAILDYLGKKVKTGRIEPGGGIPATGLSPGLYFLKTGNLSFKFLKEE